MNKTTPLPLIALFIAGIVAWFATPARGDDTALWLARSCVGEAGWNAYETGECASILHIYLKRSKLTGETTLQNAKRYSAAIKKHAQKRNEWVMGLREDGERPTTWPKNIKWKTYRAHWVTTLFFVELFLLKMVADPLPMAMHYGCKFDTPPPGAKLIETKYRNRFYR